MKKLLSFILVGLLSWSFAQTSVTDSTSGGYYNIDASPALDSLVLTSSKAKCYQVKKANSSNTQQESVDICSKSPKVKGYRIQIMYTKDRNTTSSTLSSFKSKFPEMSAEMKYTRPDYRILVGEYFTKRSGAADMARIKKEYPGAFFVSWSVWCRKAK